jgi:hypothetical protein
MSHSQMLLRRRPPSRPLPERRASRAQVEKLLRELAFVLHATQRVRESMPVEAGCSPREVSAAATAVPAVPGRRVW